MSGEGQEENKEESNINVGGDATNSDIYNKSNGINTIKDLTAGGNIDIKIYQIIKEKTDPGTEEEGKSSNQSRQQDISSDKESSLPEIKTTIKDTLPIFDIVDADQRKRLVEISNKPGMRNLVIDCLAEEIHKCEDPTKRYWIYVALGEIKGKKARSAVKKGLSDEDEIARLGAEAAWKVMNRTFYQRIGGLLAVLLLCSSCVVVAILGFSWGSPSTLSPGVSQGPGKGAQAILKITWSHSDEISITMINDAGTRLEVSVKLADPPSSRYLEVRF